MAPGIMLNFWNKVIFYWPKCFKSGNILKKIERIHYFIYWHKHTYKRRCIKAKIKSKKSQCLINILNAFRVVTSFSSHLWLRQAPEAHQRRNWQRTIFWSSFFFSLFFSNRIIVHRSNWERNIEKTNICRLANNP